MTPLSKQRFLSLFVLFGILSAILIIVAQPVRADIIVNKDKYWNVYPYFTQQWTGDSGTLHTGKQYA